jgi:hypothetical protein
VCSGACYIPIRRRTSSADSPVTRIIFLRLVSPDAMVTEERGTSKRFAKNLMQASLARPSIGGAVKANFNASPSSPMTAFFLARGCTLTAKLRPAGVWRIGIIEYFLLSHQKSLSRCAHRLSLLQWQLQNRETFPSTVRLEQPRADGVRRSDHATGVAFGSTAAPAVDHR